MMKSAFGIEHTFSKAVTPGLTRGVKNLGEVPKGYLEGVNTMADNPKKVGVALNLHRKHHRVWEYNRAAVKLGEPLDVPREKQLLLGRRRANALTNRQQVKRPLP